MNAIKDRLVATRVKGDEKTYQVEVNNKAIDGDCPNDEMRYKLADEVNAEHKRLLKENSAKLDRLKRRLKTMRSVNGKNPEIAPLMKQIHAESLIAKEKTMHDLTKLVSSTTGKPLSDYITFSTSDK